MLMCAVHLQVELQQDVVKHRLLRLEVVFLDRNPDTLGERVRKGLERMRDRQTEAEEEGEGR